MINSDAYNSTLQTMHPDCLIRHSQYSAEEDIEHEFKEIKANNPERSIQDTIERYAVGFLNSAGGEIIWGIDDNAIIKGFTTDQRGKDGIRKRSLDKLSTIKPCIAPNQFEIDFIPVIENGEILSSIFCFRLRIIRGCGDLKYKTSNNKYYYRQNGATLEYHPPKLH